MKQYIQDNKERFFQELFSILRIPSISAKPEHRPDMRRCAQRLVELLLEAGADSAQVMETDGNPVVFGQKIINPDCRTILVYGHYDVQPAEPLEKWNTDPFEPVIHDDAIWCRGANDDKGQLFMHIKAFEFLVRTGQLRHNVKFIFEGEEEIGSPSLEAFISEHKDLLACDFILVSDTSMIGKDTPSLTTGLRGLCYWQIEVTGPNRDLHSGHFGGAVKNPINALCEMLSKIVDEKGHITIPHFYDDVVPMSEEERKMLQSIPFNLDQYKRAIYIDDVFGEEGYCTLERNSCRPSFDICGIWGGYTGEGSKTVLPSKAYAKVSSRLVANQDHKTISKAFVEYIQTIAPKGVRVIVTPMHGGEAYLCPIDLPAYKAAEQGFSVAFGKRPIAARRGGSIPIIASFERILGVKTILMGFGLEANAIHSPNESMDLEVWEKGIIAVTEFYKNIVL